MHVCNLSPMLGLLKTQKNPNTYFSFHSCHHQKLRCLSLACSSGEFAKDISMHDVKFAEISSRVPVYNAWKRKLQKPRESTQTVTSRGMHGSVQVHRPSSCEHKKAIQSCSPQGLAARWTHQMSPNTCCRIRTHACSGCMCWLTPKQQVSWGVSEHVSQQTNLHVPACQTAAGPWRWAGSRRTGGACEHPPGTERLWSSPRGRRTPSHLEARQASKERATVTEQCDTSRLEAETEREWATCTRRQSLE